MACTISMLLYSGDQFTPALVCERSSRKTSGWICKTVQTTHSHNY